MVSTTPEFSTTQPAAAARAAAPATTRDPRLDFFRGIAMIIILFAHTPGNFFTSWIPARWGFSDATEMFVFCSGMASAIAFGRTFDRAGWTLGTARVAYRCWQVYWAHIGMFFAIAAAMVALNALGPFERNYVGQLNLIPFFEGVTRDGELVSSTTDQFLGLLTLTYVPNYFDILPMYLVILAMMPFVILLYRINPWLCAAVMLTVWLFAQRRILDALGVPDLHLGFPAEPWSDREWFFNPFGWQLVFFTGFALMAGWIPKPPVKWWLIALAALIVLANIPLSNIGVRAFNREWFGLVADGNPVIDWRVANRIWITKSDFGLFRYLQFLSLAYLAWVMVGEGGKYLMARSARLLPQAWDFIVRQLMKIGQQSLAVFVFSMMLARLNGFWLDQWGREAAWHTVFVNLVGVALLLAVAYFVGWVKGQPWRVKRP
ncbi:OpgC family protein [Hasllibacter sp. MH4015]|uniref:OpgC family protein n=1 Tax=Hasllibacter sp. MH4015 TaxID=2854029 RepID=UPI001CD1C4E2|nr:OpgC domain-containing protein [Hasllibacter sp. MH4015]